MFILYYRFYLDALLDHMVHTVVKLEWQDKTSHHHRCFSFLLEQLKTYYLPKICPSFNYETSLYRPNLGKFFLIINLFVKLRNHE